MESVPAVIVDTQVAVPVKTPEQVIARAAHVATLLKDIIRQQKLFTTMGQKDYPHVDAWICLGSLMDAVPREKHIEETKTGDFIATVEIVNKFTKEVMMEASSMCGADEPTWSKRPRFARRSMAVTRATGKAFRLLYSWVMCMAGYAPTPEEEMPGTTASERIKDKEEQPVGRLNGILLERGVDPKYWDAIGAKMKGKKPVDLPGVINEVVG